MEGKRILWRKGAALGLLLLFIIFNNSWAGGKWYNFYENGIKLMKKGKWEAAIKEFEQAVKVQAEDNPKVRTYGMNFIEYYPHREMGIAYYNLGQMQMAAKELDLSLYQAYTEKAREYRAKIGAGVAPPVEVVQPTPEKKVEEKVEKQPPPTIPEVKYQPGTIPKVGERLRIAVLPFENKSGSADMGEVVLDKMITSLVNRRRFNVLERSELQKVLEEHKLGMTGIIDASAAAKLGKGMGVDAVVMGSVTITDHSIGIDSRVVDTETFNLITSKDGYSKDTKILSVKATVDEVAEMICNDIPLVGGSVIKVEGGSIYIDIGSNLGLRKGMKAIVYREGEVITHPVTGEVLGKKISEIGEILLTEVFDKMASCRQVESVGTLSIAVGDKVVTKL